MYHIVDFHSDMAMTTSWTASSLTEAIECLAKSSGHSADKIADDLEEVVVCTSDPDGSNERGHVRASRYKTNFTAGASYYYIVAEGLRLSALLKLLHRRGNPNPLIVRPADKES